MAHSVILHVWLVCLPLTIEVTLLFFFLIREEDESDSDCFFDACCGHLVNYSLA